ncbi:MAG TPA: hypothetical protein O0X32_02080, partial [Methanocorpusculum sp.]|nr:hypothetical protein [Methanocorpusculum sp.]
MTGCVRNKFRRQTDKLEGQLLLSIKKQTIEEISMNSVSSEIFRALHEEKWLTIKYHNKNDEITLFWIGIKDIKIHPKNPVGNVLKVEGMHLGTFQSEELTLSINRILEAHVVDGTYYYCENRDSLIQDITDNPSKYRSLFNNTPTLEILDYLV